MRKPITIIAAVTALAAACLAPVAQASTSGQRVQTQPATNIGDGPRAGLDGFWAWQSGAIGVTDHSAVMPIKFNKDGFKTPLHGYVSVSVYRDDLRNSPWVDYGTRWVWSTSGDEKQDVTIGDSPFYGPLVPGHTYRYLMHVTYKFKDYYNGNGGSTYGTFTTAK